MSAEEQPLHAAGQMRQRWSAATLAGGLAEAMVLQWCNDGGGLLGQTNFDRCTEASQKIVLAALPVSLAR